MQAEAFATFNVGLEPIGSPARSAEAFTTFNVGLAAPVAARNLEAFAAFNVVQWFSSGAALIAR